MSVATRHQHAAVEPLPQLDGADLLTVTWPSGPSARVVNWLESNFRSALSDPILVELWVHFLAYARVALAAALKKGHSSHCHRPERDRVPDREQKRY
jgi:hypothetical protein